MRYGVIFDLDNTLLCSSSVYYRAWTQALLLAIDRCEPYNLDPKEFLDIYYMMESEIFNADDKGKGSTCQSNILFNEIVCDKHQDIDKFARMLANVYVEALLRRGRAPKMEDIEKVMGYANRVFTYPYKMMEGANHLLNYLIRRRDIDLFMVTHGNEELQAPKLRSKKAFQHFEEVVFCPGSESKGVHIKNLMAKYDDIDEWFMVGDSVTADMNPALACGIWAFHVVQSPSHISLGKLISVPLLTQKYVQFESLDELRYYFYRVGRLNGDSQVSVKE